MRFSPVTLDFDVDGFAEESPEAPARSRCSCGRFLPAWSSMPHCKACRDAYNARLLADIEAQIAKEEAHGEAIKALAVEIENGRDSE